METGVFLEARRGARSSLLILGDQLEGRLPVDITVTPTMLEIKADEDCETISLPVGVRITPSSCRGLQYISGDGLHMRLQVQLDINKKQVAVWNTRLQAQKRYIFYCQSCGDVVMQERVFLRVLPLPSENWNSLVEEWCCHPDPFANRVLRPNGNDCFLGDTYLLVNSSNEGYVPETKEAQSESHSSALRNDSMLTSKENARVICKRCKAMLGETVSSEIVKYYITEIMVQPSCEDIKMIPRSQFVESIIAEQLVAFSSARSTFRFCLQGHDGRTYILLWLLNSDTLLVESAEKSASGSAFTLFENSSRHNPGSLDANNAVKILYHPCTKFRNKQYDGDVCHVLIKGGVWIRNEIIQHST
ncbi:E3 ubiquitin-protein ligase E3D isoform X2 [Rhinatrema bivittatum]|uniref:E3 ubiquitin-protein ligase E3D isoform X2 n=1 Tax=Rhinatrema bivittatum TaxID=194408 RepID=UPI001129726C|nr:E3 ubiquitin-protein ligase E3D isoform X2 [Rhinatrema bivittatum]